MAISASFHRNVLLLTQIIQPNDEFKKHFREGMFDKPNTAGFLHVSHYLLTVYDLERFKKLVEWPVTCKKSEAKYRNNVKDFITIIAMENPDIGFPNILMSHLIHAGGSKFTIMMWKLSQVAVRNFLKRETTYNVIYAPQVGTRGELTKKFFHETNMKINSNILKQLKNMSQMENTFKHAMEKEKERLNKIIAEIFEKEKLLKDLADKAPVHPSIKNRLKEISDEEVIKMWKANIGEGLNRIQQKNKILKDLEQLATKVNNIVLGSSCDIKILDAKQLQRIDPEEKSDLFPPDIQCLCFQLYKDEKILLNNFIVLLNVLLNHLLQYLKLNGVDDFSDCLLQIETSCKDAKSALDIIQSYLLDITRMTSDTEDILCQNNVTLIHDNSVLPIMNNDLIRLSPLIKIDTNCSDVKTDLYKRLELTPVEAAHKPLFARYERLKQNHASSGTKLRENLLVSRINFDDTIASIDNDKPSVNVHTFCSRKNLSSFKPAEKYSRLFSTRTKRNNRAAANTSIMSIPCSSKANSTVIANAIEEIHDISELSLNISTKSICNVSVEFVTPEKVTARQSKPDHISEMEDVVNEFSYKANLLDTCKPIEMLNDYDDNIVKNDCAKQKRRSIGDLVQRYKKFLEASNRVPSPKLNHIECDNE